MPLRMICPLFGKVRRIASATLEARRAHMLLGASDIVSALKSAQRFNRMLEEYGVRFARGLAYAVLLTH